MISMNEHALISIIVPVYNIECYIAECIESIIRQTYTDIEIILVDDGSRDQSGIICDAYAGKDKRIRVMHKVNGGLSDARNSGLDIAHGDYIMFVDGDDYITPAMCENLLHAILRYNADIGICNFQIIGEGIQKNNNPTLAIRDGVISGRTIIEEKVNGAYRWIVSWNKLYRKELFRQVRFPVGKLHEDEFVFFDLLSQCDRVACVEEPLYCHVERGGSIMTSPYSVQRLDGCEALLQRGEKLIENKYSSECVYTTIMTGIELLNQIFDRGLYRDPAYRKRYHELLHQYRKIGFGRLLRNAEGINRKFYMAAIFIDIRIYRKLTWVAGKLNKK